MRFFEQSFQRLAMSIGGNPHAKVALSVRTDLTFESEQHARNAHRKDDETGDAADGEMAPEEKFSNVHVVRSSKCLWIRRRPSGATGCGRYPSAARRWMDRKNSG